MNNGFYDKLKLLISTMKTEYCKIEKMYNDKNIYKNSFPLKASKKCNHIEKKKVEEVINQIFVPSFETLSKMIDAGIIELHSVSNKVSIDKDTFDNEVYSKLIYESWDKLFVNKYIKYNVILGFVAQLYVAFEKEYIFYLRKNFSNDFKGNTLFSALTFFEKNNNFKFNSNLKKNIDKYRNIINVYKHGIGDSYYSIKKDYPNILNSVNECDYLDTSFVFNLNEISFNELYGILTQILDLSFNEKLV